VASRSLRRLVTCNGNNWILSEWLTIYMHGNLHCRGFGFKLGQGKAITFHWAWWGQFIQGLTQGFLMEGSEENMAITSSEHSDRWRGKFVCARVKEPPTGMKHRRATGTYLQPHRPVARGVQGTWTTLPRGGQ
jgi:hypothetical protein